ncbi:MAG TPA: GYD domain-containing protein [Alphaproteobacteria bacterium]|nr:GYD domain-containing protein [Alphaproteobacteria bacterium]
MPKYLIQASYNADGVKGLHKEKASGRKAAVSQAVESLGGKLESIYYAFGDHDVIVIIDLPDNASASALALAVSGSGLIRTRTTPLLTVEETDRALQKNVTYRPPGK